MCDLSPYCQLHGFRTPSIQYSSRSAGVGFINVNIMNVIQALFSRSVRNVPSSFGFMELASVNLGVLAEGRGVSQDVFGMNN